MSSSIVSLAELLTEVTRLLDGEDVSVTDLATSTLTRTLRIAEKRIYRELKSRFNEKAFSGVTVTGNLAPIPSDFKSAASVSFGKKALLPMPDNWMLEYLDGQRAGPCRYFSEAGASFRFAPAVTDGTALQGRYFCELPALTSTTIPTNAVFQEADDLFVYATLVEAAIFFSKGKLQPAWEAKYESIRDTLNLQTMRSAYSAGRMRVQASTPVLR